MRHRFSVTKEFQRAEESGPGEQLGDQLPGKALRKQVGGRRKKDLTSVLRAETTEVMVCVCVVGGGRRLKATRSQLEGECWN